MFRHVQHSDYEFLHLIAFIVSRLPPTSVRVEALLCLVIPAEISGTAFLGSDDINTYPVARVFPLVITVSTVSTISRFLTLLPAFFIFPKPLASVYVFTRLLRLGVGTVCETTLYRSQPP